MGMSRILKNRCFFRHLVSCTLVATLGGCEENHKDTSNSFTFETGITLQSYMSEKLEGSEVDLSYSVQKVPDGYLVRTGVVSDCTSDSLAPPYLTDGIDHKATLVLKDSPSKATFHRYSECWGTAEVTIANRLQAGDTVYILNNGEVLGHLVMP